MIKRSLLLLLIAGISSSPLLAMNKQRRTEREWGSVSYATNSEMQYHSARLKSLLLGVGNGQGMIAGIDSTSSMIEVGNRSWMINETDGIQYNVKKILDDFVSDFFFPWMQGFDGIKDIACRLKPGETFQINFLLKDTDEHPNTGVRLVQKVIASEQWKQFFYQGFMHFGSDLDLKDYQEAIDEAGLVGTVEVAPVTKLISKEQCTQFLAEIPFLDSIPDWLKEEFKRELFEEFETLKNEDGFYVLTSSTAKITATKPV